MVEASQTSGRGSYWTLEVDRVLEEVGVVVVVDHPMSGEVVEVDGQEEEEDRVSSLF